jgi:hypothetical protein
MARARAKADDTTSKPPSDAYTGMLLVSLLAMIAGCLFLYLDYSEYPTTKPDKVKDFSPPRQQTTP